MSTVEPTTGVPRSLQDATSQVVLIHLSDIHFGSHHRFNPEKTPGGDTPKDLAFPTLARTLAEDLKGPDPGCPVHICITGDLAQIAHESEFAHAERFVGELASVPILGRARGMDAIHLVPGNHDVIYTSPDVAERWAPWIDYHNRLRGTSLPPSDPWALAMVVHRPEDRLVLACFNSAIHVEKGKPDEDRGNLDNRQLTALDHALTAIPKDELAQAVKVALIHHHPVLIPALAEPGRGYDAVHNSGFLLSMLRRFGFHAILHGHKHNPHTFTDDARAAHQSRSDHPILVAAGGSVGSTALPSVPGPGNCYNVVTIKWHPEGRQSRVRVETRGLRMFDADRTPLLPTKWQWESMKVDDRHFYGFDHVPSPSSPRSRPFDPSVDDEFEARRTQIYEGTRGNLPVVQVQPSLVPGQAYEAVLWITPHPYGGHKAERDIPVEVVWSAGRKFEVLTVRREEDPFYTAQLTYWGPMLVQARLRFSDGHTATAHVYARMPVSYERRSN